ncbi:MAG: glycine--tRNA ligase subunit beta [Desulfobulbaceae bacterium]|nr:glycine--tRNA ligase subunit beta [Desulfobulbaceae bacterium]
MNELLFEIGTEEIPAGYIKPALQYLEKEAADKFSELNLKFIGIRTFGTPRRLTLAVEGLETAQADMTKEHVGPPAKAGFDADGNPTKAAVGFAKSKGLEVTDLEVVDTPKGQYLLAKEDVRGRETIDLLPSVLEDLLRGIAFPKSMRWAHTTLSFARPIQWLLVLFGGKIVNFTIEGITSGNSTKGHRFMAPEPFSVSSIDDYVEQLRKQEVVVDPAVRREMVIDEVREAVKQKIDDQGTPLVDEALVDIVTNLVELPCGVCGRFDESFLELPEEVLITSMREHQKYFPVVDAQSKLLPLFVAMNNTRIKDKEKAANGHERVLRARLEDAIFFYGEDKKTTLAERSQGLGGIVFHHKLGTMAQKAERMGGLASYLARKLDPETEQASVRAAGLVKADLLTEMVGEFPTLQGVMGKYYGLRDGEDKRVAQAIEDHYKPVRPGADLPTDLVGAIVGLADRVDTVCGCFAIGQKPTGAADPFGLRRLSLGLIQIVRGLELTLSLKDLVLHGLAGYGDLVKDGNEIAEQVIEFIRLRFENDSVAKGMKSQVVLAATSVDFDDILDCVQRMNGLDSIRRREEFSVLAGSFKRIRNIIKDNVAIDINSSLFSHEAEKELHLVLTEVEQKSSSLITAKQYEEALETFLLMKEPVDKFFDDVMVMDDDLAVRQNRLNLLTALANLILQVGDISKMSVE